MGERRATNKYYPQNYDPSAGSLNAFRGVHPLGDRARKLRTEHVLIVRFEMPYNVWCVGCEQHIGKGVRYNAEKRKIGKYFSSPIYQFRMKCHLCDMIFEIHTDPKTHDFKFVSGVRRKVEAPSETAEERGVETTQTEAEASRLQTNPMFKVERVQQDRRRYASRAPDLQAMLDKSAARHHDVLNARLRAENREARATEERAAEVRAQPPVTAIDAFGEAVKPTTIADEMLIQRTHFRSTGARFAEERTKRRLDINMQTIFDARAARPAGPSAQASLPAGDASVVSRATTLSNALAQPGGKRLHAAAEPSSAAADSERRKRVISAMLLQHRALKSR